MNAPFVKGSETSASAALAIGGSTAAMRARILDLFDEAGPDGLTCDEIECFLDMKHQTASARVRELSLKEAIYDTGETRNTRSGCKARIYLARARLTPC